MPKGETHDAITMMLAVPVFVGVFIPTGNFWLSMVATVGFLFGGLMFGPDLDTRSKHYSRWWWFRILWFPYRSFFKHRSRWTHGFLFGTLLRVVYFMGVVTCAAFLASLCYVTYAGGEIPGVFKFTSTWQTLRVYSEQALTEYGVIAIFVGMWLGAASHTLTDIAGTYIKTGRTR